LLAPSLALVALAAVVFAQAETLTGLLLGRFLAGVGTGGVTIAANAALIELAPQRSARYAAMVSSLSFGAGAALGPIATGVALQLNAWPTVLPFLLIAVSALVSFTVPVRRWNTTATQSEATSPTRKAR